MNKKVIIILVVILVIAAVIIGAVVIGGKGKEDSAANSNAVGTFSMKYKDVEIVPGTEFKADAFGESVEPFVSPNCAFGDEDKIYSYEHLEITAANINGKDTVCSVYFLDTEISTTEGVSVADNKNKMIEKYGEEYKESVGRYTYTRGNVELSFLIEKDIITGIEYTLIVSQ